MSCNDTSKPNALLDMVTQGLNPAKNQCYFIPYGNKMQLQRSYHGIVMKLKRDPRAQDSFPPRRSSDLRRREVEGDTVMALGNDGDSI
ncbi:recombinase RecT, partial [Pseudomonas aeruginosa]|nr:recombinase RecT [Pseudomonas aeruginosa]